MIRASQGWTPSLNYWNILERKIRLRRMTWKVFPAVLQLTVLGPYLPPASHHPAQTVRAPGAPGAPLTTGCQSSPRFTSPSAQWCYKANLYKVTCHQSESERKYLFVLTEICLCCRSEQIIGLQTPSLPGYQDHPGQRTGSHKEFRWTLQVQVLYRSTGLHTTLD